MTPELTYLHHLFTDCGIVEIRHHVNGRWESGLFDDVGKATRAIEARRHSGNLYTSLNRPICRPVTNEFGTRPLRNDDIATIRRIVFDFDPARPPACPSLNEELELAIGAGMPLSRLYGAVRGLLQH